MHSPLETTTPLEGRKIPCFPGLPGGHLLRNGALPPSMLMYNGDFDLTRMAQRNWTPGMIEQPPPGFGRLMESCVTKAALGGTMGGVMGVLMGVFIGMMNTNAHVHGQPIVNGQMEVMRKGWKREFRDSFRSTGFKCKSWAKSFAYMTVIYSSIECAIENPGADTTSLTAWVPGV